MSKAGQKYIKPEDVDKIRTLAKTLNEEYSPRKRMDIQQEFVREMGMKYDHESATMMLTKVWKLANRMRAKEEAYV